ncbi:MAG: DUF5694 domain-containing protein [Saprospiraceae bacterium]
MIKRLSQTFLFLFSSVLLLTCLAQQLIPNIKAIEAPFKAIKKSQVMILGTFHFNDGGNDAYKPKFTVNIKSPKRQAEVKELVTLLSKFKPTKVTIENMSERQGFHDSLYTQFIQGKYEPGTNEIYQVCYRLAALMHHKKLYTIDAPSRSYESEMNIDSFAEVHHQKQFNDTMYSKMFFALYARDDSLKSVLPLKTFLAYHNNPERLKLGLGHYLIDDFKVAAEGQYPGADGATSWWNRNLRIFSNILRLAAESKEERVFVMIGAGHLQILRFLAMACPEIEFIDAYNYLK